MCRFVERKRADAPAGASALLKQVRKIYLPQAMREARRMSDSALAGKDFRVRDGFSGRRL
jgi:hypothetical protein